MKLIIKAFAVIASNKSASLLPFPFSLSPSIALSRIPCSLYITSDVSLNKELSIFLS